ncbi:hypothetical protein [Paracidovorax cattleyae]|uniref:hypothetical protein n=1 Tax=Paracidovorax cattleyae TaxID=80868 RepID=UPI00115FC987|nr:hypothetical protein [Paracidovorax cattleyae]MBF9264561.1 hypothetical protein [Paracidovorax cattleyae]
MLSNFLPSPSIEIRTSPMLRRKAVDVVQSALFDPFEAGLKFSAPSAISEAELAAGQRVQKLQRVIRDVNAAFYEDFGRSIDAESAKGFEKLVKRFEAKGVQSVSAASSGRIVATWRTDEGALTLEFLNAFKFKFAITCINDGQTIRRWGTDHLLNFLTAEPLATRFLKAC